jgi:pectinesterase
MKDSFVSGDTDFIFGNGTAVLDHCEVQYVSDRKNGGNVLAPDTDARNPYGILVIDSQFTADATTASGVTLGRAWDHNCTKPSGTGAAAYMTNCVDGTSAGAYPNGQALIANSTLGGHIDTSAPWAKAATTGRPYSSTPVPNCDGAGGLCPANRLYEYQDNP